MATSVNIGGGNDQFNRYKMPPVQAKVEGRGNGIKTRIVNCADVARALHRPPGYVCKFFGCELGAQTRIDDNAQVYIVNGAFQQSVLADTLKKFIDMFVLCSNCKLPETDLKLKKNGNIVQVCNACGTESICDMTHKLCTYIANNPPDGKKKKGNGKLDKAARRALKAKKSNGAVAADVDDSHGKHSKKSGKKNKKEAASTVGLGGNSFGMVADFTIPMDGYDENGVEDEDEDVEWSVDTSKEAEEARLRELGAAAAILERVPAEDERNKALKLRAYMDDGKKPSKVIAKSAKIYGDDDMVRGLLSAALVDELLGTMMPSVEKRVMPVLGVLGTPMEAEAQTQFLEYLDFVNKDEKIVKIVAHLLKAAYDHELLEDSKIRSWFDGEGPENVRSAVKGVVEWIEDSDDDGSDGSDEETDDE